MPSVAAYSQGSLALIYSDLGAVELATAVCDGILAQSDTAPIFWQLPALPAAQVAVEKSDSAVDQIGLATATLITPLVRCELALALGDAEQGLHLAEQFIVALDHTDAGVALAEAHYYQGQALLAKGNIEAAQAALTQAHQKAKVLQAQRMAWRILLALAEVAARQNDLTAADELCQESHKILDGVIERVPDGVLRESFVGLIERER